MGQKVAAEYLADFVLDAPADELRDYRVLSRYKSEDQAEDGRKEARRQFDQMVAYQQELQKAFAAASVRRT